MGRLSRRTGERPGGERGEPESTVCTRAARRSVSGRQALRGPSFLLPDARQQRGCCSDFRTSPEPCPATAAERTMDVPQSISHLHHPNEAAFSSPGRSPLRISSLSGGHLRSPWAEWWPKSGACPTCKPQALRVCHQGHPSTSSPWPRGLPVSMASGGRQS